MLAPLLGLALASAGCDGCRGGDRLVPFKADAGAGSPAVAVPADPPPDDAAPFAPRDGHVFPEGTHRVAVEGAPFEVDKGAIRALLAEDVGGDGARDALAVVAFDAGGARLVFAPRQGKTFGAPAALATLLSDAPGCTLDRATVRWLAPSAAVASAARRCEDTSPSAGAPAAAAGGEAGGGHEETALALVSFGGGRPRVSDVLRATTGPGGEGPADLADARADRWTIAAEPLSPGAADGEPTSAGGVGVRLTAWLPSAGEPIELLLPWREAPGGLRRDPAEPEATLAALADDAAESLGSDRSRGAASARAVLALHALTCREGGEAQLRIGDAVGLPCGPSAAAGRAASVLAAARASDGDVFGALDLAADLGRPGWAASDRDRARVEDALARMPTARAGAVRDGPSVETLARPPAHRSRLAFLDEDRVLVRGETPRVIDFSTGTVVEPTPELPPRALGSTIVDPAGRFAVAAVERRCPGVSLAVLPAADVVAGVVVGRPVAHPLLLARPAPPGCPTDRLPDAVRRAIDGWLVLGWAPQGVVAARGRRLRVVPLTTEGHPAGAPFDVAAGTPPPAPLVPGAVTANGLRYVVATGWGLVVQRVAPTPGTELHRPAGWDADAPPPTDPAVSPSGERLAFVQGGRVRLLGTPDPRAGDEGAPRDEPDPPGSTPAPGPGAGDAPGSPR